MKKTTLLLVLILISFGLPMNASSFSPKQSIELLAAVELPKPVEKKAKSERKKRQKLRKEKRHSLKGIKAQNNYEKGTVFLILGGVFFLVIVLASIGIYAARNIGSGLGFLLMIFLVLSLIAFIVLAIVFTIVGSVYMRRGDRNTRRNRRGRTYNENRRILREEGGWE